MFLELINTTAPPASAEYKGYNLCHLTYYHYKAISSTQGTVRLDFLNGCVVTETMLLSDWLTLKDNIETSNSGCRFPGIGGGV